MAFHTIKECWLYYAKVGIPVQKMDTKEDKALPLKDKEYSVDVLVTTEDFLALEKKYKNFKPKIKALVNARANVCNKAEFILKFKVEPPFESEEYYTIKLRKSASFRDGKPSGTVILRNIDKTLFNPEVLMGNGTFAAVQVEERESKNASFPGWSLPLTQVVVRKLVEFNKAVEELDIDFEESQEVEDSDEMDIDFEKEEDQGDGDWADA